MQDVRRLTVYADDVQVDLALPAHVPIGSLLPPIVDIVTAQHGRAGAPMCYRLSTVGEAALDASKTLAQHGIRDGTELFLSASSIQLSAPRFDDAANAVSTALTARTRPPTSRACRLTGALAAGWLAAVGSLALLRMTFYTNAVRYATTTAGVMALAAGIALAAGMIAGRGFRDTAAGLTLGLLATGFAAVAGLLAVPGGPGAPNALLAAAAAAATSVLAVRMIDCGTTTFTALCCVAVVAAAAALAAAAGAASLRAIGATTTVVSLGLLEVSARMSILLAGLSPQLAVQAAADRPPAGCQRLAAKAARADAWLTGLVGAFSTAGAFGAIGTLIAVCRSGGPQGGTILFAATTGTALLWRSRSHPAVARAVVLTITGTAALSAAFVVAATANAGRLPAIAVAMTALTAGTLCAGFVAPAMPWSPVTRRAVELLEYAMLAALVPLGCWICGLYSAARGLTLP